jgi:hypothetical protein
MRTSHQRQRRLERIALLGFVALLVLFGSLSVAGAATAANTPRTDDGIGLIATVAPHDQAGGGSAGGTGGGHGGGGTETPSAEPAPTATATPGRASLGGIVFVSGLSSSPVFSIDPTESSVTLRFTVRNDATSTFSSTARFWVETPFGNRVGTVSDITVAKLKPNETRVVQTTVSGLGQWTALHAYVKFVPPQEVDGKKLSAVTRDSFVFVAPVFAGGIGIIGVGLFFLVRFLWVARTAIAVKAAA